MPLWLKLATFVHWAQYALKDFFFKKKSVVTKAAGYSNLAKERQNPLKQKRRTRPQLNNIFFHNKRRSQWW